MINKRSRNWNNHRVDISHVCHGRYFGVAFGHAHLLAGEYQSWENGSVLLIRGSISGQILNTPLYEIINTPQTDVCSP